MSYRAQAVHVVDVRHGGAPTDQPGSLRVEEYALEEARIRDRRAPRLPCLTCRGTGQEGRPGIEVHRIEGLWYWRHFPGGKWHGPGRSTEQLAVEAARAGRTTR